MELFNYPSSPGFKDRDTSLKAAASVAKGTAFLQRKCIEALRRHGPMTPDETAGKINVSILAVRPRFTELLHAGAIANTGERRLNASRRWAKVYAVI